MLVAVASKTGVAVDEHFGHAKAFDVSHRVLGDTYGYPAPAEVRRTMPPDVVGASGAAGARGSRLSVAMTNRAKMAAT